MKDPDKIWKGRRAAIFTFTLLRVAVGAVFVAHGWQKLIDIPGTVAAFTRLGVPAPELGVYVAIGAECGGGLGVLLGAFTEIAAWGPIASSVAALYFGHAGHGPLAGSRGWEFPLILLFTCFHFVARGGGVHSVDARMRVRARPRFRRRHRHVAVQT